MNCRIRSGRYPGFSLVELLTVVGIIALLISILVPSLAGARRAAKVAATRSTFNVLETSIETFKLDQVVGGAYPESAAIATPTPYTGGPATISPTGAALLVWALAGADYIGTPGFRDLNGNGTWRDDMAALYSIVNNQAAYPRSGPFVSLEKLHVARQYAPGQFEIEKHAVKGMTSPCFLDAFEYPILYYRANPAGARVAQKSYANAVDATTAGMYYLEDNVAITGYTNALWGTASSPTTAGLNLGRGISHPFGFFSDSIAASGDLTTKNQQIVTQTGMGRLIADRNVTTAAILRPQRSDSYLLLSPGPDGLYGTADDVGNFNVNK
jgi:type II secretory pathway pseudopilin PulG